MDFFHTLVLALIQGITEFLPVSSSAHLVFPSQIWGWPDQGLSFDVAVHFGTLAAVMVYYRSWLGKLFAGFFNQPSASLGLGQIKENQYAGDVKLVKHLLFASIPVFMAGAVMEILIPDGIRSTFIIGIATIVFGLVLYVADKKQGSKSEYDLVLKTALIIGLAQVLALIPGTSRSGITIAAGLFLGMSATGAANFSFLLSIPTILAATALKTLSLLGGDASVDWVTLGTGAFISGVFAYLSISWFISFLNRVGMVPFVIYRLILGVLLLAVF
ncbi:MAG: undecaprenyl-diphosphate phosphatase [Gammaproteobacteria bacterium]|nr:undecaprenyl-diphosphate phosphatase [Gammaproteobacteria bacterium]|tara:strand:- start:203 stop:1021 length:819 start_codon:yes stop_codon:yes gene_type:complete